MSQVKQSGKQKEKTVSLFIKFSGIISTAVFVFGLVVASPVLAYGQLNTTTINPIAVGQNDAWNFFSTNPTIQNKIDAVLTNDGDDSIIQSNGTSYQTFVMSGANLPSDTEFIQSIILNVVARKDVNTPSSSLTFVLEDATTTLPLVNSVEINDTYETFSRNLTTNQLSQNFWKKDELNNGLVKFGVLSSGAGVIVTQVYVTVNYFTPDITDPVITEVIPIQSPTEDTTPEVTFTASESGSLIFTGGCSSATTNAQAGINNITLNPLTVGYHSCNIKIIDSYGNISNIVDIIPNPFVVVPDINTPFLAEVTSIPSVTDDNTPSWTFKSTLAGEITYIGGCSSATTNAQAGDNAIIFNQLSLGDHSCSITVTSGGNVSDILSVNASPFTVIPDIINPVLQTVTPVQSPTQDTTPNWTFFSTEEGNIEFAGGCTSATTVAYPGNNTITFNPLSVGDHICSITVTDASGNTSTVLFILPTPFTIEPDTTDPVLTEVTPITSSINDATPSWTFNTTEAGSINYLDNCYDPAKLNATIGNNTVTFDPLSGGDHFCSISVTDGSGNVSNILNVTPYPFTTVTDTPPVVSPQVDIMVEATSASGAQVIFDIPTATDDFDTVTVSCLPASNSIFAVGTTTVICSALDTSGNAGLSTFNIIVQDTTAPIFNSTSDITVEATSTSGTAVVYYNITANDIVDGVITAVCNPVSGSTFLIGTSTVTCLATDAAGNSIATAFNVIVQDTTAPNITVSSIYNLQSVEAESILGTVIPYLPEAYDQVDGNLVSDVVCSPVSGSLFSMGPSSITCTVTDAHGNTGTLVKPVMVVDTTAPALSLPVDQTFEATGALTSPVFLFATATDTVDAGPIINNDTDGQFPLGTTIITWSATDASSNVVTGTSKIIIIDTTVPVITLVGNEVINLTVGDIYTEQGVNITDNYDAALQPVIGGDTVNTNTAGTYNITYDVTDSSGNTAVQKTRTVVVKSPPAVSSGGGGGGGFVAPAVPVFSNNPIVITGSEKTLLVQLAFNVSDASLVSISESPTFAGSSWLPYVAKTTFTLSAENKARKLYIKFRSANGGETQAQEMTVPSNSSAVAVVQQSVGNQQVLGIKITRPGELASKLKIGNRGVEVVELQAFLRQAGYFPAQQVPTGYYGVITSAAVKKYLAANISPEVLEANVARANELVAKLKIGAKNTEVIELQTLLKQTGYFPARQIVTGYYGSITSAAVKKYLAAIE